MLARAGLGLVELCRQALIQNFVDERGLARTGDAGDGGEGAQRNRDVDIFQVVLRRAFDGEGLAVALAAGFWNRNFLSSAQILAGHRALAGLDRLHRTGADHFAAVHARPRADVHNEIGGIHGVLIVLDHDDCVAQVAQMAQGGDQLIVVALVQADARLVEDVQYAHQRGADLGGQTDALALTAREGGRSAGKGQIFQTDVAQKFQAGADFPDNQMGDLLLLLGQLQLVKKVEHRGNRKPAKLTDIEPADQHRQAFLFQTVAVALGAVDRVHPGGDLLPHPVGGGFAEAALQVVCNALKLGVVGGLDIVGVPHHLDLLALAAVEQDVHNFLGQVLDGGVQRKVVVVGQAVVVHARQAALDIIPAAGADGALADRLILVRDNQVGVDAHEGAEAGALFTGTKRVVEGEHPGIELLDADVVLRAGVVLGEHHLLTVHHIHQHQTAGQADGGFQRVGQAGLDVRAHHQAVDHNLDVVLFVLFQRNLLGQLIQVAVHPHPDIAGFAGALKLLLVHALFAADDGGQNLNLGALRQLHHLVHHLVDRLLADLPPADRAVRHADARIEQAQVVVDFGDGAHGGARVFGGGFLVDRDGRRQAGDLIDVRLFHHAQKLAGIGGKALHIPALSVGVDGIESKRRLARTGEAGKDNQLIPRNFQVDVFQVMLPGTVDHNFIVHRVLLFAVYLFLG